ncbi:hypothetical protein CsSME_00026699 [Camellia sinensis var. sinensis]
MYRRSYRIGSVLHPQSQISHPQKRRLSVTDPSPVELSFPDHAISGSLSVGTHSFSCWNSTWTHVGAVWCPSTGPKLEA